VNMKVFERNVLTCLKVSHNTMQLHKKHRARFGSLIVDYAVAEGASRSE
jgi:hypothetical protein